MGIGGNPLWVIEWHFYIPKIFIKGGCFGTGFCMQHFNALFLEHLFTKCQEALPKARPTKLFFNHNDPNGRSMAWPKLNMSVTRNLVCLGENKMEVVLMIEGPKIRIFHRHPVEKVLLP